MRQNNHLRHDSKTAGAEPFLWSIAPYACQLSTRPILGIRTCFGRRRGGPGSLWLFAKGKTFVWVCYRVGTPSRLAMNVHWRSGRMMNILKIQAELAEAVTKTRAACADARKNFDAAVTGASSLSVKDVFTAHTVAIAAHRQALKEFSDYHLNGCIPPRLETTILGGQQPVFGNQVAPNLPVAT
jgi:hypothetical protein